jgi:hypothetical protein
MRPFWIFKGLKFAFFAIAFVLVGGFVIMHLWNWLIPSIFTTGIGFTQALGILVLARILVGGMGRGHGWGGRYGGRHYQWKEKMENRMSKMTPEEREQFKQRMKEQWGNRCGPCYDMKEEKTEEPKTN